MEPLAGRMTLLLQAVTSYFLDWMLDAVRSMPFLLSAAQDSTCLSLGRHISQHFLCKPDEMPYQMR